MWIVSIALRRPYTFVMAGLLIVLAGGYALLTTATDIFPNIKIPIAAVIWRYNGMLPEEIANRIVLFSERIAQTTVNDAEHTESQSVNGVSVVKYFFQPDVDPDLSFAQITAISQTQLFYSPPGTSPPLILSYSASSVPILQLALSSDSMSEAQIYDVGNTILRTQLATVAGASIPYPYGGKQRQVQVDLDPQALRANGLSPNDVVNAIGQQNLILPAGTEKIGPLEYYIKLNASPTQIEGLNNMPVRAQNGTVTYVRDLAHVRDGYSPQTNMVRVNGRRAVLMSVLKNGKASTIDIIDSINHKLPQIRGSLPSSLKIEATSDQSVFVRSAISGVLREAAIAGALTGLLILLFLGSWRSTLIITISIPLSILASIACLSALGETINIMTLGGLALAVGILVDDATVTIENINYHLEIGRDVEAAILEGAHQIALPALVSTLCICIVFIPMFLLAGIAKFLFIPLAEAVVFAMLASYLLSRTLVPTLAKFWLKTKSHATWQRPARIWSRGQAGFERGFERLRERYKALLAAALHRGPRFAAVFFACTALTAVLAFPLGPLPGLGQDFFPTVDGGQIKLHMRARTGTRIEETAALCDAVEGTIREVIPPAETVNIVDNIGLPYSGLNLAYSTSAPVGPGDADIYVNLAARHKPTRDYVRALRSKLAATYPSATFAFLPADMIGQILNFGLPSPIDVQVVGFNVAANREVANRLLERLRSVPGAVDLHIQQQGDYPQFNVDVDRGKAQLVGLTEQTVANNLLVSLSGNVQTAPSFWIDPKTGTQYQVVAQTPQFRLENLNDLANTPLNGARGASQILSNIASIHRSVAPIVVSHYNATPVIDIYGSVQGTDLGYVSAQIDKIVEAANKDLPKGSHVALRGQVQTMRASFNGLLRGLVGAIVLIYILIVINFQSLLDPFVIITALPAALAGIVWMLFLTDTPVSVPALMGAIMCMGVATANSVLVISFARERMDAGDNAFEAALQAGFARIRPVVMTATAMMIGMIPMALGFGDGGEQNAPLGRAVIGGLIFATIATLFFVPTVFSIIHGRKSAQPAHAAEGTMSNSSRRMNPYLLALFAVALLLAAWGEIDRVMAHSVLAKQSAIDALPTVVTVRPSRTALGEELVLPGTVQAFIESPIYARTNGYLKAWYTDIGSAVKRGELLAEIETPEVDQQLAQAVADLATARANEALAQTTNARWKGLLKTGSVSQQDADEKAGDAAAKKAAAEAAAANVSRLRELESFKRVVAPFDGIITARNTDIGALINAGQSAGSELFRLADTRKLRIYVQVPEPYAAVAKPGLQADLSFSEQRGKAYTATVVRTSNALDPDLRTLQVELQLDNSERELFPGAYAEVHFKLPANPRSLRLPAVTILFRASGLQVATVDSQQHIQLKSIVEGRDFGNTIEVLSGLDADDAVVINPPDSIINGMAVRLATPPTQARESRVAKAL